MLRSVRRPSEWIAFCASAAMMTIEIEFMIDAFAVMNVVGHHAQRDRLAECRRSEEGEQQGKA
jgi:hypothetical protein